MCIRDRAELRFLKIPALHLPMPGEPRLQRLCQELIANPDSRQTLETLAEQQATSSRTLARQFQRETGMSFRQWRQQARLVDALGHLANNMPVALVAGSSCGASFGEPLLDSFRTYLGAITGPMRGRDGNVHRGRPKEGMPAMISHLGSLVSVVNGMLFARRLQGRLGDGVGATSIGEGGTSTGAFHEGLNQAAVERLPLVVAVANNQYAYSTTNDRQFRCEDLVDLSLIHISEPTRPY